jgi:hypothetical protein
MARGKVDRSPTDNPSNTYSASQKTEADTSNAPQHRLDEHSHRLDVHPQRDRFAVLAASLLAQVRQRRGCLDFQLTQGVGGLCRSTLSVRKVPHDEAARRRWWGDGDSEAIQQDMRISDKRKRLECSQTEDTAAQLTASRGKRRGKNR